MGSNPNPPTVLTVGNYCHDILIKDDVILAQTLGGAVAFISEWLPLPVWIMYRWLSSLENPSGGGGGG
ncbi:hypothetical protein Tco_0751982 [Tanacetum coccineum]|uniref:Uncharacterized protein n=1 Tax=Tanacetum coccineum TaxID=301880 RepID=A0ABQ4Z864_9ASTR